MYTTLKRTSGFTLVELLIVILIIAMITMLALPAALSSMRTMTFVARAREVVSLFEEARTQALASRIIEHPDGSHKIPPGGYGVMISMAEQTAVLFIDDWNEDAGRAVDMDYFDLANRTLPDGVYTPGRDRLIRQVTLPENWLSLTSLRGERLAGGALAPAADNTVTAIFQPPYGDVLLYDQHGDALISFVMTLTLTGAQTDTREITLHRVTTTPQLTTP